jgi:hypothetical protein
LKSKGYTFSAETENDAKKLLNVNNYVAEPIELYNVIETMLPSYAILEKFYITIGINAVCFNFNYFSCVICRHYYSKKFRMTK